MLTKPKCDSSLPVGEWCEGDGTCGTDDKTNSCFFWEEIYMRVDCVLTPPSPPPPLAPYPPFSPGESAYFPAPPPPSNKQVVQGLEAAISDGFFGPISLPWFIVIIIWAILIPILAVLLYRYCLRQYLRRRMGLDRPKMPSSNDLGYGGTLVVEGGFTGV